MHKVGSNVSLGFGLLAMAILLMLVSCQHKDTDTEYIRQSYYIDDNASVGLCPFESKYGNRAEIVAIIGDEVGRCEIPYDDNPYIYDVTDDTIFVRYEMMHTPWTVDTVKAGFIDYVDINGHGRYVVKGEYRYFYNGWAVGRIDGMTWNEDYSYPVDSVVNTKDSFYFYKGLDILYEANQRDVEWDMGNRRWLVSYVDSFKNVDGYTYKMRKIIRFVESNE